MNVIIAGTRTFNDYFLLSGKCDYYFSNQKRIIIVSGKNPGKVIDGVYYKGADNLGEQYAKERGFVIKPFPANWKRYGPAAGPIRNKLMAEYSDCLVCFWDGKSSGTANMIEQAYKNNLKIRVVKYE